MTVTKEKRDTLHISIDAKMIYDDIQQLKSLGKEMIKHQKYTNGRVTNSEEDIDTITSDIQLLKNIRLQTAAFAAGAVGAVELVTKFLL